MCWAFFCVCVCNYLSLYLNVISGGAYLPSDFYNSLHLGTANRRLLGSGKGIFNGTVLIAWHFFLLPLKKMWANVSEGWYHALSIWKVLQVYCLLATVDYLPLTPHQLGTEPSLASRLQAELESKSKQTWPWYLVANYPLFPGMATVTWLQVGPLPVPPSSRP